MKKFLAVVFSVGMALMAIGCTKSSIGPVQSGAPTIPSEATMQIPQLGEDAGALAKATANDSAAYSLAKAAVVYWTLTVDLALVKPVALFKICHSTQPKPLDDKSGWKWTVADGGYSATLVGRIESDSVRWSMTVSGGSLSNFKWFDGTSTITGSNGYWTFYDTTSSHPAVIRFSYNISAAYYGDITATVVNPSDANYNSYLKWTSSGTDKYFEGFDAVTNKQYTIYWNAASGAGSIQERNLTTAELVKYCWDTTLNNHRDLGTCQ